MQDNQENGHILFRLLSSYILFLFSAQVITIGISLAQVRISAWLARGILCISIAVALIFLFQEKGLLKPVFVTKRLQRWQFPLLGFLGIAFMTYLILWAAATVSPDLSFDGNAYHIPAISMWDMRGYIFWVNTNYLEPIINGYPKGVELVAYILVKALNNSIINAVNLIFLPMGVIGIAFLARSLGTGRLLSLCAGATFILIPVNINQSTTTYVDSAYASSAAGLIAGLVYLSRNKSPGWKGIITFGAAMGLTLGIKSTGIALSGIALFGIAGIWIKQIYFPVPGSTECNHTKQRSKAMVRRLSILLAISMIALAGGGYWYIRNYLFTGTPLYPVGITILGRTIFPGLSVSEAIWENSNTFSRFKDLSPVVRILFDWAQGFNAWPLSIKGYDSRDAGLGFLWLLACVPSIGISITSYRKFNSSQKGILLTLIGVIGLAFLITPMNWWARYTIWIYILGLPYFAAVLNKSVLNQNSKSWQKLVASIWMSLCLFLLLFEAGYCTRDVIALASPGSLRSNMGDIFKEATWKWPSSYLFPDMREPVLEDVFTHTGTVAIGPHGDMEFWRYVGLVGELSQPIGARHLVFLSETHAESELNELAHIKYIIWDSSVPLPPGISMAANTSSPAAGFLVLTLP